MSFLKNYLLILFGMLFMSNLYGQMSMSTFLSNVNNISENDVHSNIVQSIDDGGTIAIIGNGNDNVSNLSINIIDNNNNLIETLIYPTNTSAPIYTSWKIDYIGISGAGNSCINGGKDYIRLEDLNGNVTYDNPDQCVKLCLWDVINQEFPNNTAVIGQDSVVFTAIENTTVSMSNSGSNFSVYINNTLQPGGFAAAALGQVIKIKPLTIGVEEIYVESNSCGTNQANFTVASNPLPITWSSNPIATIKYNQCQISWPVASQVNNSHFNIEYSKDGRSYTEIGKVQGHGSSSEMKQYSYIHETPSIGINYYRIKQVDYDGQSDYSDVVSVVYGLDGGDVRIFPNPVNNTLNVVSPLDQNITIVDALNRIVLSKVIKSGQNIIDVSNIVEGMYFVQFENGMVSKMVKE